MPELAKCHGAECPIKDTCFRFTKKSDDLLQLWLHGAPYDATKGSCKMHVENYAKETKDTKRPVRGSDGARQ
jgi:hypothetical protein